MAGGGLGKSRLVKEFIKLVKEEKVLYYTAFLSSHQYNLRMLLQAAEDADDAGLSSITVEDLNSALLFLYRLGGMLDWIVTLADLLVVH